MGKKIRDTALVLENIRIAPDIFSLLLKTEKIAHLAGAGQFVSVYCSDNSRLLPRPISICETDREAGALRLVFRIAGKGTEEFSRLRAGDSVDLTGPLGNGFPLERAQGKTLFLIGGGIGIPPMVQTAKDCSGMCSDMKAILGYRDGCLFLREDLERYAEPVIATEDGSAGTRGNVLDAIRERELRADVIFACGPTPMLRALKAYAQENSTECWLSLEEKMACGAGACLSCVCRSAQKDEHSQVKNKRVCTEGPVFLSSEVEL